MTEYLDRPDGIEGPEIWVEEAIWGHRVYDEQTPWLTFLEFLTVFVAETEAGRGLKEPVLNSLSYRPQQQLLLRNIVFNNPFLTAIERQDLPDERKWTLWSAEMKKAAGGIPTDTDFIHLKDSFASFGEFGEIIGFLRNTAIEYESNKRWSSKFVFPFGKACLYEDLRVQKQGVSVDRRFFARSGELLYMMLCRSNFATEINKYLANRLLSTEEPLAKLAEVLQAEPGLARNPRCGSYLPYDHLQEYDALGQDWLSILRLEMPIYDALPHLVNLASLHMIRYIIGRCMAEVGSQGDPEFVCEIVGPKKTAVRDISADSFQGNQALPRQAMETRIRKVVDTEAWTTALESNNPVEEAAEVLRSEFDWPNQTDPTNDRSPDDLVERLVAKAGRRHKQHVAKVHAVWTRGLGLTSRRNSRRNRYAPSDQLLKTLVICRVEKRMEFKEFLQDLADHYGMVIGDTQAARWIEEGAADQQDFSNNARRLEQRLASLGLLNRLSDSCAYVENPFVRAITS